MKHLNSSKDFQNSVKLTKTKVSRVENLEVGKINKNDNVTEIESIKTSIGKGAANVLFVLLLFSIILSSGCLTDFNNWVGDLTSRPANQPPQNVTTEVIVHMYESEKIIYYHCDDETYDYCIVGMEKFMAYSENFLRCSFTSLEDEQTARHLIELLEADVSVKVLLDKESSFDAGLPLVESQYLLLLRNLIDVQTSDVYENFCVSDRGVLISNLFYPSKDKLQLETSFIVIYSTDLSELYNNKYFEKTENN